MSNYRSSQHFAETLLLFTAYRSSSEEEERDNDEPMSIAVDWNSSYTKELAKRRGLATNSGPWEGKSEDSG